METIEVKITTTAKRDQKIDGVYLGLITYSIPTNGKLLFVDYVSDNPKNKMVDIKYSIHGKEKFTVKGLPADKPLDKLTDLQKLIVASSLPCIYGAIKKAATLSFAKTQLTRTAGFDRNYLGEWKLVLAMSQYTLLFNIE